MVEKKLEVNEIFRERLKKLMDWNGVTNQELAGACGCSDRNGLNTYIYGRQMPPILVVCKIADFFMVSVDWLLGRVDELDEILSKEMFNTARVLSYKNYVKHERDLYPLADGYLSPWPYNLAEEITGQHPFYDEMNEDRMAGLNFIVNEQMSERTKEIILMRYKDGMTLDEISKKVDLTKERVRQIYGRAIRNARHPSRSNYILYGLEGERIRRVYENKKREYESLCYELELAMGRKESELEAIKPEEVTVGTGIEELDLSVRSYNCLKRANLNTVNDILNLIRVNYDKINELASDEEILYWSLLRLRNMGKRSALEVIDKLKSLGFLGEKLKQAM